jgi:hypothetical protein
MGTVNDAIDIDGKEIGGAVSSPDRPNLSTLSSGQIRMYIEAFNKMVSIDKAAKLDTSSIVFTKWDAIAELQINVSVFREMFFFQSDYYDVNDVVGDKNTGVIPEDIRFYVKKDKIPSTTVVKLSEAIVTQNYVTNNNLTGTEDLYIKKDYVRYLAKLLFGTAFGTDLFTNETELVTSVKDALDSIWNECKSNLEGISTDGDNQYLYGAAGFPKYLTAEYNDKFNICQELFKILISNDPTRFKLSDLSVNSNILGESSDLNIYRLPFNVGDEVVIRTVLSPNPAQKSFMKDVTDTAIQDDKRVYLIVFKLIE